MATIYQVSEAAGVSLATVSRVMNGNAKVSERTRKKVEDAKKKHLLKLEFTIFGLLRL